MSLPTILFIVVMLHILVGFGWALYKIEFSDKKKKEDTENNSENKIEE